MFENYPSIILCGTFNRLQYCGGVFALQSQLSNSQFVVIVLRKDCIESQGIPGVKEFECERASPFYVHFSNGSAVALLSLPFHHLHSERPVPPVSECILA